MEVTSAVSLACLCGRGVALGVTLCDALPDKSSCEGTVSTGNDFWLWYLWRLALAFRDGIRRCASTCRARAASVGVS